MKEKWLKEVNGGQWSTHKGKDIVIDIEKEIGVDEMLFAIRNAKMKDLRNCKILHFLNGQEVQMLRDFFEHGERSTIAFEKNDDNIVITGHQLEALLFNKLVDGQVIDWFSYYLDKATKHSMTCILFKTSAATGVLSKNKGLEKRFLISVINEIKFHEARTQLHYMAFPIYNLYHWSLLVLHFPTMSWYHYNSRMPKRPSTCAHAKEGKKLKNRVVEILDQAYVAQNLRLRSKECSNIKYSKCPQQPDDSVDCAMYVCKFMEYLKKEKSFEMRQLTNNNIQGFRARCACWILSDERYSWSFIDHMDAMVAEKVERELALGKSISDLGQCSIACSEDRINQEQTAKRPKIINTSPPKPEFPSFELLL